jgi:hypothetical protein
MALHGPIKVNNIEVGYWSAQRIETGVDGINTYRCCVDWTPEGFVRRSAGEAYPKVDKTGRTVHAQRHTFTLRHDYRDGAVALAAKVLAECIACRARTAGGVPMTEPKLTEAEHKALALASPCVWCDAEPNQPCREWDQRIDHLHPERTGPVTAVEAILAARLAPVEAERDMAERQMEQVYALSDAQADEVAALRRQVADLSAEREALRRERVEAITRTNAAEARAEAAERALADRDLCSCGHEPHLHDTEAVPSSLCLICGHEDDCGLTAADAVGWRAKERSLRAFHREAIAEAAEEVAARDEVIARVRRLCAAAELNGLWSGVDPRDIRRELAALDGPAPQPKPFDPATLNRGTCPKCREWKFIGHGPLCIDCYATPPTTDAEEER